MDCLFCDVEKHRERIITETKDFYVMPTVGQITDGGYVLVIPKKHIRCLGDLGTSEYLTVAEIASKMAISIMVIYRSFVTMFEHGIVGQSVPHAHLHILPAELDITSKIKSDFPNLKFETAPHLGRYDLPMAYSYHSKPYLLWQQEPTQFNICWDPPTPKQYLRKVAAEMLGRPERADWRNVDPKLDKQLMDDTVKRLKPYFPKSP